MCEEAARVAKESVEAESFVADLFKLDQRRTETGSAGGADGGGPAAVSALQMLNREQLVKVTAALSRKIQAVDREKANVEQYISESQAVRVQFSQQAVRLKELEDAHMEQGRVLLRAQKEGRKLDKYRDTIALQEGVIAKMQDIIEEKLTADPLQYQQLQAEVQSQGLLPSIPEKLKTPMLSRPPSLLSPAGSAAKFTPISRMSSKKLNSNSELMSPSSSSKELRAMVEQLQAEVTASADENAELRSYAAGLEQQLQELPAPGDRPSAEDVDAYQVEVLKADVAVRDIRIEALEARLQKAAQEYAKEISKLRVLLFEFEMNASLDENDEDPERRRDAVQRADDLFLGENHAAPRADASMPAAAPVSRGQSRSAMDSIARAASPTTGTTVSVVRSRGGSAGRQDVSAPGGSRPSSKGRPAGSGGSLTTDAASANAPMLAAASKPTSKPASAPGGSRPSSKGRPAGSGGSLTTDAASANAPMLPTSKPASAGGVRPDPASSAAATDIESALGGLAGLQLGDLDGVGPAMGDAQALLPPGERDMAGKLNLKQVVRGNLC